METESIVVMHPLSFRRGVLIPYLNFLTTRDTSVTFIKDIKICKSTAEVLGWTYNNEGWPRVLPTAVFVISTQRVPDDLIGLHTPDLCAAETLKGHFYDPALSKHDTFVSYSRSPKEFRFYKDLFSV